MNDLEEALVATLERHARKGPAVPDDLRRRVAVGYRRRRVVRAGGAVTAVVVAVAGLFLGAEWVGGEEVRPAAPPKVVTPTVLPIEKQWPGATRRIAGRLSNGSRFTPEAFIDDRTLLISTRRSSGVASGLYRYDLATGRTVQLGFPRQKSTQEFVVGSGRVGWLSKIGKTTEIWTMPLSGGPAAKLYTSRAAVYPLELIGGAAYWSAGDEGVFRAPFGGAARRLPGTGGLRLMSWPWAGGPVYSDGGSAMADDAPTQRAFKNVRNLVTGERRSFTAGGEAVWTCAVSWCGQEREARSRDGRRVVRPLPGQTFPGNGWGPAFDRFLTMTAEGGMDAAPFRVTLVDLETGKGGSYLSHAEGGSGQTYVMPDGGRLHYQDYGASLLIIDLAKIS